MLFNSTRKLSNSYGNKTDIPDNGNNLLRYIIPIIVETAIIYKESNYFEVFEDIISNKDYPSSIKGEIITEMSKEKYITNPEVLDTVLDNYVMLLKNASITEIAEVDFFLLYSLIQLKTHLYSMIKPILEIVSNSEFPKTLGYDHTFHFKIIDYLKEFGNGFPLDAVTYIFNLLKKNPFLYESFYIYEVVEFFQKIFENNKSKMVREFTVISNNFLEIMQKIPSNPHYDISPYKGIVKKFSRYLRRFVEFPFLHSL